jgi:hypothetical protein
MNHDPKSPGCPRQAPSSLAVRHGARPAFARARADQLALELGQAAEHSKHEATVRCSGIGPPIAERSEASALAGDRREGVQEVSRRSRQAIEAGDHEHVAGVELSEHAAELVAIGLRATGHLAEHLARAGGLELAHLGVNALAVGRYACVDGKGGHGLWPRPFPQWQSRPTISSRGCSPPHKEPERVRSCSSCTPTFHRVST